MEFSDSPSGSESELSDDNSDWSENENKDKQKGTGQKKKVLTKHKKKSTPPTPQSDNEEGNRTPDSGNVSDNSVKFEPTSPSHPAPKAKPPLSPKPVNLKTKPEAPPATTITNETKESSTVKDRCKIFGGMSTKYESHVIIH